MTAGGWLRPALFTIIHVCFPLVVFGETGHREAAAGFSEAGGIVYNGRARLRVKEIAELLHSIAVVLNVLILVHPVEFG